MLPKIDYDYRIITYDCLYRNPELDTYTEGSNQCSEAIAAVGLYSYPKNTSGRAYTIGAFVTSIDGKIAYPDNGFGPLVASTNYADPVGAKLDFWILNLLRAGVDGICIGAGTMQKEPDLIACVFDGKLEDERVRNGLPPAPMAIVCSINGDDIPYEHLLFDSQPAIIYTSPAGLSIVKKNIRRNHFVIGPYETDAQADPQQIRKLYQAADRNSIPVIVTGTKAATNSSAFLRILYALGLNRVLIESPSFTHSLLQDALLDELVLSKSLVYIGGNAIGLGRGMEAFTSTDHPHARLLSLHGHLPGFLYFRYGMIHGLGKGKS